MSKQYSTISRASDRPALATNSVIRNTYILLSLTLMFSACTAGIAMAINAPPIGLAALLLYFGLFFLVEKTKDSIWGLFNTFLLTGVMGFTLGPILNLYIQAYSNGGQLVMTALGGTGLIFLGLSAYALTTRKDFSYLGGFLMGLAIVCLFGIVLSLFTHIPMLQIGLSCAFMLFACGAILFETSQLIHNGQRNYISATVALYLAIYNLFLSLLQLLAAFAGNRD
jgi:modulator of FtsH protease